MICRYCHETSHQERVGTSKAGLPLYHCKHCDQLYTLQDKGRVSSKSVPEAAPIEHVGGDNTQPAVAHLPEAPHTEIADEPDMTVMHPTVRASSKNRDHETIRTTKPAFGRAKVRVEPIQTVAIEAHAPTLQSVPFPGTGKARFFPKAAETTIHLNSWGWLPEIALVEALGLLILAWGFVQARAAVESAQIFLWIGLAVLIMPVVIRQASAGASRQERIALVVLLGVALYLVKVMHSPLAFTFPDELSHLRNVQEILESHRLFQENPVQPVTAFYPGLPILTSTLSSLSGLSVFHAGLLVIGAARLILFLSLYFLFERVSGSVRVAGLATVIYMTNPNFLYWTAEYAYEPLALPLLVFALLMVSMREMSSDPTRSRAWTAAAVLGLLTVIITHHMSSYILTGLLVVITVLSAIGSLGKYWGPWKLTLAAVLGTAIWLLFVANLTIKYLSPVLTGAIESIFMMIAEEEVSRELFTSTKAMSEARAPVWEQFVAMGSVILIALGLPLGAYEIWKRHHNKVFAILLGAIALSYLPVQMLRLTKDGWETANRSSEFLFIGIGFVLALGISRFWLSYWPGSKSKILLAGLSVALLFGGLIAGWPPRARLARPYTIDAGEHLVRPQIVTVSEWMVNHLGPDNRVAASKADAKVLGTYAQHPFTDNGPIKNVFLSEEFGRSERISLLRRDIQYVISDRKNVSWDHMIGYYFYSRLSSRTSDLRLIEPHIYEKFEGVEGVTRMLDSGDIIIYDVRKYLAAYRESEESSKLDATNNGLPVTPAEIGTTRGRAP